MTVFILMGVMCGIASSFFVGRMGGSVSSTMGTGYEMTANLRSVCLVEFLPMVERKSIRTCDCDIDYRHF